MPIAVSVLPLHKHRAGVTLTFTRTIGLLVVGAVCDRCQLTGPPPQTNRTTWTALSQVSNACREEVPTPGCCQIVAEPLKPSCSLFGSSLKIRIRQKQRSWDVLCTEVHTLGMTSIGILVRLVADQRNDKWRAKGRHLLLEQRKPAVTAGQLCSLCPSA